MKDGGRVTGGPHLVPRRNGGIQTTKPESPPKVRAVAVSSDGYAMQFSLEAFVEPSTRSGRRYARAGKEAEMVGVEKVEGKIVSLSLNTKRYAASPAFELEGLPPDAPQVMGECRATPEGKLTVAAG